MKSRRHRAIYWAKVGRKTKWHTPFFDDVIFLKPLTEDSVFFTKAVEGGLNEILQPKKPKPIEDFKNAMSRLGKRLWRLRHENNNKKR